ncbi:MAG TPA: hypothetical protein VMP03_04510 [Methylomirabilota bacterium]|nr:hypothetical protein [Methylomirabilota bacterium]
MLRYALVAAIAAASIALHGPAATAATVTRDALERLMLDACIYRQFQEKDVNRSTMVDKCRCAVRTAMTTVSGDSFTLPRSGGLTGPQDQAVRSGIAACFKG